MADKQEIPERMAGLMSDEQVKGIAEEGDDFRPNRESLSNAEVRATGLLCQGAVLNIARELIESRGHVARSEQALAELQTQLSQEKERNTKASEIITARERLLDQWNEKLDGLRKELAQKEQALAALEGRNAELKAALRRLIGACVRPNGMLQPPDVDSEYAARAALAAPDGQKEK